MPMKLYARFLLTGLPLFAACGMIANAQLTIDPIYSSSITSLSNAAQIEAGIQASINSIDADIANPVTIDITFSSISTGLGDSNTDYFQTSYASYVSSLQNQTLSSVDNSAITSLGSGTATNPVNGNANITTTAALLTALQTNVQGMWPSDGGLLPRQSESYRVRFIKSS